ncbi:sulfatase [soil metagenome]
MKPANIVMILIDDLGARDLGCFGSTFYETPSLDRLARQGMSFDRAYASCPVCSPTRASILTGKYPARVGITQWIGGNNAGRLLDVPYLHYLPLEEQSLATALRQGGYQTWHVGKWHLGDAAFFPEHHGFDVNIGGCHWGSPKKGHFSPWQIPTLPDAEPGKYLADEITDQAIRLLNNRDRSRPFFLNLWHYAVHTPIQAPAELVEKYRRKAAELGLDQIDPLVKGELMSFITDHPRHVIRRMFQSDPVYAAMIENLDTNVGRLLDALAAEGLAENTVVVFTSDNGGVATAEGSPTCNLPLAEGKGWAEEGGNRVCQLMRWPGRVGAGTRCATPVTSTDFYPTFLDAAGLPPRPEQHVDGVSLVPLLDGNSIDREAIFWHYPHYSNQGNSPSSWVISGDWKLIEYFEDGRLELFNLQADPSEARECGLAHPDVRSRLHRLLANWRSEVEAKIPAPNPDYERLRPRIANNAHE